MPSQPGGSDAPGPRPEPSGTVRTAAAEDVPGIGAVLERSWRTQYAALLPPDVLPQLSAEALAEGWRPAVLQPPSGRHAVLVAREQDAVVGLAAVAPSRDGDAGPADGELAELAVDPEHQRAGHGSRLLAAAADTLSAAGFAVLRVWVAEGDEIRYGFLLSAGLRPDGARRTLQAPDGTQLDQVRLSARLPEPD